MAPGDSKLEEKPMKALALFFSFAVAGWSQAVTATLLGTITDSSGGVVADARVSITETQTGVKRTVTTNADGLYTQPYLPPGIYQVEVERQGFKKISRGNIELQ